MTDDELKALVARNEKRFEASEKRFEEYKKESERLWQEVLFSRQETDRLIHVPHFPEPGLDSLRRDLSRLLDVNAGAEGSLPGAPDHDRADRRVARWAR